MLKRKDFDAYVEQIKNCVEEYERRKLGNRQISLLLSNGKQLHLQFADKYVAHMLGINTTFLKNARLCRGESSYEILKDFLNNSFSIFSKLMKDGMVDEHKFFSPYIDQKLSVFLENTYFSFFSILAVTELDHEKTYMSGGSEELLKADYFIIQKLSTNQDFDYGILALCQSEKGYYSILSSMGCKKEDLGNFKKYFYKQNVMIPYNEFVSTDITIPAKKFWHSMKSQLEVYSFAKSLKEEYQMSLCMEKYYELLHFNCSKQTGQNEELNEILKTFIQSMMNGTMVNELELNLDSTTNGLLKTLIDIYNTTLIPNSMMNQDELEMNEVYLAEQEKVKKLQKELTLKENLEKKLEEIEEKYTNLKNQYEEKKQKLAMIQKILNEENEELTILEKSL